MVLRMVCVIHAFVECIRLLVSYISVLPLTYGTLRIYDVFFFKHCSGRVPTRASPLEQVFVLHHSGLRLAFSVKRSPHM